jgi:predicted nucleotidyltransferase
MDKAINNSITAFLDLIRKAFPDIETAYLFGSYANGHPTSDSDIDIALIFKFLEDSKRFDVQVQLMLLAAQIDSRIEPHPISAEQFNATNPFAVKIKNTGIELFIHS